MRHKIAALLVTVTVAFAATLPVASVADAKPLPRPSHAATSGISNSRALAASAPTAGGLGSIDATSLAQQLLSSVAGSAGSRIGGAIAGWALDSIFGSSAQNNDEIKTQIEQLSTQLSALTAQVAQLRTQLDNVLKTLAWQAERNTYDQVAAEVNRDAATLADYQIRFDSWLTRAPGTPVDASQSDILLDMRRNLGQIINHLNDAMIGAGGARGLIEIYGSVTRTHLPYYSNLTVDRLYTSDLTTPVSDQLDYYEGLAVQAFNMLAEVNHLSWTIGGTTYAADDAYVETYAALVPKFLANWNQMATSGVGRLPDSVVADAATGIMWSRSNLSTVVYTNVGDFTSEAFCWAGCTPELSLSSWLTPTKVIDGLTGWGVPSQANFAALLAGHDGDALNFLRANGFKWRARTTITIDGLPIPVPSYWSYGGNTVTFNDYGDGAVRFGNRYSWLGTMIPGPGAVANRSIG